MGFLVSQRGQLGAIPPPPFLSVSPFKSVRSGGAIPPLKRGISAILARYPMKTRQMGAIPPSAILSRKGIARYGGVSRTGPLSTIAASIARYEKYRYWASKIIGRRELNSLRTSTKFLRTPRPRFLRNHCHPSEEAAHLLFHLLKKPS